MCREYDGAPCRTPQCPNKADCQWDPFCKDCRAYMYDNGEDERWRFPKYEVGD